MRKAIFFHIILNYFYENTILKVMAIITTNSFPKKLFKFIFSDDEKLKNNERHTLSIRQGKMVMAFEGERLYPLYFLGLANNKRFETLSLKSLQNRHIFTVKGKKYSEVNIKALLVKNNEIYYEASIDGQPNIKIKANELWIEGQIDPFDKTWGHEYKIPFTYSYKLEHSFSGKFSFTILVRNTPIAPAIENNDNKPLSITNRLIKVGELYKNRPSEIDFTLYPNTIKKIGPDLQNNEAVNAKYIQITHFCHPVKNMLSSRRYRLPSVGLVINRKTLKPVIIASNCLVYRLEKEKAKKISAVFLNNAKAEQETLMIEYLNTHFSVVEKYTKTYNIQMIEKQNKTINISSSNQ